MARWVLLLFLVALLDTAAPLTVLRKISNTFQLSMASSVSSSNGIGEITNKGTYSLHNLLNLLYSHLCTRSSTNSLSESRYK